MGSDGTKRDGFEVMQIAGGGPVSEVRARGENAPLLLRLFVGGLDGARLSGVACAEGWMAAAADSVPPGMMLRVSGHSAELLTKPRRSRGLSSPSEPASLVSGRPDGVL